MPGVFAVNELVVFLSHRASRLAEALGAARAEALRVHLETGIVRATTPRRAGAYRRTLCYGPIEPRERLASRFPGETLEPQSAGELSARVTSALKAAFGRGASTVVVVGTSAPGIDSDLVDDAFAELRRRDVVLRAAANGRASLLGLARFDAAFLEGVPWESENTIRLALARAESTQLRSRVLGTDVAIETLDDLRDAWPKVQRVVPAAFAAELKPLLPPEPPPPYVPEDEGDTREN